jgi:hypothetical protein
MTHQIYFVEIFVPCWHVKDPATPQFTKVLYLWKVAPFRSTIFRLEIKREDIIDKSRECDKDRSTQLYGDFCMVSKQINLTLLEIKREGDISLHRWRYLCDIVPYNLRGKYTWQRCWTLI